MIPSADCQRAGLEGACRASGMASERPPRIGAYPSDGRTRSPEEQGDRSGTRGSSWLHPSRLRARMPSRPIDSHVARADTSCMQQRQLGDDTGADSRGIRVPSLHGLRAADRPPGLGAAPARDRKGAHVAVRPLACARREWLPRASDSTKALYRAAFGPTAQRAGDRPGSGGRQSSSRHRDLSGIPLERPQRCGAPSEAHDRHRQGFVRVPLANDEFQRPGGCDAEGCEV